MTKLICFILIISSLSLATTTIPASCLTETIYSDGSTTYTQVHNTYCDSIFNEKLKEERSDKIVSYRIKREEVNNGWENYLVFSAALTIATLVVIAVISHDAASTSSQTATAR